MNDNTSCIAIDDNESQTISEMDKDQTYEESSMRPQTSNCFDEIDLYEAVQNQMMLTSDFNTEGTAPAPVPPTPSWGQQIQYFGSAFQDPEISQQQSQQQMQQQGGQISQQLQQQQQFSFPNEPNHLNLDASLNSSQSQSQFKLPSVFSSSSFAQNPDLSGNTSAFLANPYPIINSNPSTQGNNTCKHEGDYDKPSGSSYQLNYSRGTYGNYQNFYNEQERDMGGYSSEKKAMYGQIHYGGDDNEDWNGNSHNFSSSYPNSHNQQQLPYRGGILEQVLASEDDGDADQYYKNYDQHFPSAAEQLRKQETQWLSLYKDHKRITKKTLVNIVLIDKQTQTQYTFDQQEVELTEDKTFNVNEVIQLDLIQTFIQPEFNFYIAQEGDISEIYLGKHPVFDEKKLFQRVSRQGQITLLFQRPAQTEANNPRFQSKIFIQKEGLITINPENDQSKDKRVQERSVREALQLVKQWRCTYEEVKKQTKQGYHIISLEKVADIAIKCKKKTLDYYFLELRKAEMYLYDFSKNLDSKMSNVRNFNAIQKDKHPQQINPPNELTFNLSDEDTLPVNQADVQKLVESSRPNKKTQTQSGSSTYLGQKKSKELQMNSRHGSFSTPEMSSGMMRQQQQGMQADQAYPKIQKDITKMPKKGNNQYPFGVGGSNGIRGGNQVDGFSYSFRLQPDGVEMGNCLQNNGDQINRMGQENGDNSIRDNQNNGGVHEQISAIGEVKMETIAEFNQQQGQQQQQRSQIENDIPEASVELKAQESMPFIPSLEYDC